MKRKIITFITIILSIILFNSNPSLADKGVEKVKDAINVIEEIMAIPEKGIPPALLHNAKAIAIIPGVIKAGFIIGGRHGKGILIAHNSDNEWSNPVFVSITGGSIGWQVGAQSTDVILIFRSKRSIDNLMKGKFTLGADASIAAGPVGRQAEAGTDVKLKSEIVSYSRSRGLFAGLSFEGAALQIDDEANAAFYNREGIKTNDIFSNKNIEVPEIVKKLKEVLKKHTP